MTNKEYAPSSFSNDKAYRRTPYVSQKAPKAKGTYLAITESYYDKEKKATRQKTIMGLGYLEDLKKDYPDPISHFEKVVADMNQELLGGKYRPLQLRADGVPGGKPEASPPVDPAAEPARISYLCELPCLRGAGDLSPLQYFPDLPRREPPADVSLLRLLHPLYRRVPKLPSASGALCRGGNPESGGGRRGAVPGGENPADGRGHHYGEIFPREEAETIRGWGI